MDRTLETTYIQDLQDARRYISDGVENFMRAGHALKSAKEKHREAHGMTGWEEEVQQHVGISQPMADSMIASYEKFGHHSITLLSSFAQTSIRMLSAPTVPQDARDQAVELAEEGTRITMKVAQQLINDAKEAVRKETLESVETELTKADGRIAELQRQLFLEKQAHGDAEESEAVQSLNEQLRLAEENAEVWKSQLTLAQQQLRERPEKEIEKTVDNPVTVARLQVLQQRDVEQSAEIKELKERLAGYDAVEKQRKREVKTAQEHTRSEQQAHNMKDSFGEAMRQLIDSCQVGCMNVPNLFANTSAFIETDWELLRDAITMLRRYTFLLSQQCPEQQVVVEGAVQQG